MVQDKKIGAIVVTHDSESFIERCVSALMAQTRRPDQIVIVDSGSHDRHYLEAFERHPLVTVVFRPNIGFSAANNVGIASLWEDVGYFALVNPDAFLSPEFLRDAFDILESPSGKTAGCLTGTLLGFDIESNRPTGRLDSTGLFRKWYGRWYDRGQGEPAFPGRDAQPENLPAICGALMFCRKTALAAVISADGKVFDERFFMHKEDVDLSLRLRKAGWLLRYDPALHAYHCRGWDAERRNVSRALRLMAARNEIRLYMKHPSVYLLWAIVKFLLVKVANV
jgi:N-acetylglucosaminyl-diphospho-decaprenol L-rhamnosyltransferase